MLHHIFHLYGLPSDIVPDQGPQFTSCFGVGLRKPFTWLPLSSGQTEGMNQEMEPLILQPPILVQATVGGSIYKMPS